MFLLRATFFPLLGGGILLLLLKEFAEDGAAGVGWRFSRCLSRQVLVSVGALVVVWRVTFLCSCVGARCLRRCSPRGDQSVDVLWPSEPGLRCIVRDPVVRLRLVVSRSRVWFADCFAWLAVEIDPKMCFGRFVSGSVKCWNLLMENAE